jgi:urease accessory protein
MATMSATDIEADRFAELPLLVWLSPGFPVGSYAYSHGLEWAVEAGHVASAKDLVQWLGDLLEFGAPRADAVVFACAFLSARGTDWPGVTEINALSIALAGSAERSLEICAQGDAFMRAVTTAWTAVLVDSPQWPEAGAVSYTVAVALAAACAGMSLRVSLQAFILGVIANLVSAAARLGAIGQTEGQRVLSNLLPAVRALGEHASAANRSDISSAAMRSDIASMKHETQYSRLFRS